jgi:hypothetical protein
MHIFNRTNSANGFTKNIVLAAFLKSFYQTFNDAMQRK